MTSPSSSNSNRNNNLRRAPSFTVADDFSSSFNQLLKKNNNSSLSSSSAHHHQQHRTEDPLSAAYQAVGSSESWVQEWPFPDYKTQNRQQQKQHKHQRRKQSPFEEQSQNRIRQEEQEAIAMNTQNTLRHQQNRSRSSSINSHHQQPFFISNTRSLNQSSSACVTATEFAILRSLFGRGDEAHNQTTDTASKLLPHVDLRWLVGSLSNNRVSYSSSTSRTFSDLLEESFQKNTQRPARSKNIKNLFGNIEAISENWSRRDYTSGSNLVAGNANPDLLLINSPRSAVALLRTKTDVHQLVTSVASAHTVNPLEARQSATSMQRVSGDRDHQLLAKQKRKQLQVQHAVNEKLAQLERVYDDICSVTSIEDIYALRDAEHKKRQVIVRRPESRVVDRSASSMSKYSTLNETSLIQKESSVDRTRAKIDDAARRKQELMEQRSKQEAERSSKRGEIQHSQIRSKILSDIEAREAAALQCQRVYNFEKKVVVVSRR